MGLIDASNPRAFKSRRGILADETTATPTIEYGDIDPGGERGPAGSHPTDLRSFNSLGDYFNDPMVQRDGRALMDMITGVSPSLVGANMVSGGFQGMGPQMPSFGINDAVADEIGSAAMGSGGGLASIDVEPSAPGMFAKGGKVGRKGLLDVDPPGPDNVIIGAKTGERILNEKQFGALSKEAQAEVERVLKARGK
jgi:hypothetical protein